MSARPRTYRPLSLERESLARLLPIGEAFRHVDRVIGYADGSARGLRTEVTFLPDDPIFAAHFPGRPVVPGSKLIEFAAQSAGVLAGIEWFRASLVASNRDADDVFSLAASPRSDAPGGRRAAMLASADLKFIRVVTPGERLTCEVWITRILGGLWRFDVELWTKPVVASGSIVLGVEVS